MAENTSVRNPRVEAIANALHQHAVDQALEEINKIAVPLEAVIAAFSEAENATDRTAAIFIFSLVDNILMDLFRQNINHPNSNLVEKILGERGILDTASARLTMAHAFHWVTEDTYHDINLLRKIRNRFAHHVMISDFSNNEIQGLLSSFKLEIKDLTLNLMRTGDYTDKNISIITTALENKGLAYFLITSLLCVQFFCLELLVGPACQKHQLSLAAVLRDTSQDGIVKKVQYKFIDTLANYLDRLCLEAISSHDG